jgi:hypothetical protein
MTDRVRSISTSLDASTVTPGRTAPDVSFATPVIALCARAADGKQTSAAAAVMAASTQLLNLIHTSCNNDAPTRLLKRYYPVATVLTVISMPRKSHREFSQVFRDFGLNSAAAELTPVMATA